MTTTKKLFKIASYIVLTFFSVIVILTFLSIMGIPRDLQVFVIETGSMEPEIKTGSLAFITPEKDYTVGEVVTFKTRLEPTSSKNYIVTHRLQSVRAENGETIYKTKGDANQDIDPLELNKIDIIGKVNYTIPYLGYLVGFAKTKMGFVVFIIIPSILIIYHELMSIYREYKKYSKNKEIKMRFNLQSNMG